MELKNVENGFVVSILFGVRNLSRLATYIGFSHLCGYVCFKFHDVDGRRIDIRRTVERFAFDEAVRAICSLVFWKPMLEFNKCLTLGLYPSFSSWLFMMFFIERFFFNCQLTLGWGLHPSTRARSILFLTSTLQKKATAYPSIGQKKLNGAASRMMIHFGRVMSEEIAQNHPSDVHRHLWNLKLKMFRVCPHDYWCCCWFVFSKLG